MPTIFFVVLLLVIIAMEPVSVQSENVLQNNGGNIAGKRHFYGCQVDVETIHCEPIHNMILNEYHGTARIVYDPSQVISNEMTAPTVSVENRAMSQPGVPNNEWQFIASTWDGSLLKLYMNGFLEDTSRREGSLVEPVLAQIGSGEQGNTKGHYWRGGIDEVRIYNRALTDNEIVEIFTKSNEILDGIVGYWTFDGNTNDSSGNNNHGVYKGGNPEFVDGIIGKALRFDGNSGVDLSSQLSFSTALSFTAWVKLNTGIADDARTIFNNNQFFIRVDPQTGAPNRFAAFVKLIGPEVGPYATSYGGLLASMAFAPDGRLFFTEKNTGNVRVINYNEVLKTPFINIPDIYTEGESGLLGLTLDPDFGENHFLYVYHTYLDDKTGRPFNRIVRFTDDNNKGTDMKVLLDRIPVGENAMHSGGALAFGPDEKLYITVGDNLKPETAQDPSTLTGKVLRINRDGTIPNDNPWLWDNNPSRIYSNEVLDENVICESYDSLYCNFSFSNPANNTFFLERDFTEKRTELTSIKFTINNPSSDVSFYRDYRKNIGGFLVEKERNWSDYTYLTFWMNGSNDDSRLGVKVRDAEWSDRNEEYLILNNFTGWRSFAIPLLDTYPTMDFSFVRGIEFIFHRGWNSTINLDAVYLTNSSALFEKTNYSLISPVYTIGHRNMFGIAFDPKGTGIVTENGLDNYDEINKIELGGNYGWPIYQPPNSEPELSELSIKPLRSYFSVIAPAQAIYYDGDKIPELKGKFLFGSFLESSIHALELGNDNEEIIFEEVIRANHTGPVISLAQSPDGYIYYGGSAIYKLERVDATPIDTAQFFVEIIGNTDVRGLQLYKDEKKMVVDITVLEDPSLVTIKIPKVLLDGILSVDDERHQLGYTLDYSLPTHNIVNVHITSEGDSRVVIHGTTVIPEFTIYRTVLAFSIIIFGTILVKRKLVI